MWCGVVWWMQDRVAAIIAAEEEKSLGLMGKGKK